MAESRDEEGSFGRGLPSNFPWWPSDFMDRFASASLASPEESLNNQESPRNVDQEASSSQTASQVLWSTGMLSEPIPNGFYSVIPVSTDFWIRVHASQKLNAFPFSCLLDNSVLQEIDLTTICLYSFSNC